MRALLCSFFSFYCIVGWAQSGVAVKEISILGKIKTQSPLILRELDFQVGDTLYNINKRFKKNTEWLINTGLFTEVDISYCEDTVEVYLEEGLKIIPFPIFELADRNFNEWWVTHSASLDRVNIGIETQFINLTGWNDPLELSMQWGFQERYFLSYQFPFIDRKQRWRPSIRFLYSDQKEVFYSTDDNIQNWYRDDGKELLRRRRVDLGVRYRPNIRTEYTLTLRYHYNEIEEEVRELNPHFFNGALKQSFLSTSLNVSMNMLDRNLYPLHGYFFQGNLHSDGLGLNDNFNRFFLELRGRYFKNWGGLAVGWSANLRKSLFLSDDLPFYQSRGIGFGAVVRSYEYYVVDGLDYYTLSNDLKYRFIDSRLNWGSWMFVRSLRKMPFQVFANPYIDLGYVTPLENNPNALNQKLLIGYGMGLDFLLYENFLFQVQWSRNAEFGSGIFLKFEANY